MSVRSELRRLLELEQLPAASESDYASLLAELTRRYVRTSIAAIARLPLREDGRTLVDIIQDDGPAEAANRIVRQASTSTDSLRATGGSQ